MKKTQQVKIFPVIDELARRLPPKLEIEETTDPDRILELAPAFGEASSRKAAKVALEGRGRLAVVLALAEEIDHLQQLDHTRVLTYERASEPYRRAVQQLDLASKSLESSHQRLVALAEELLPQRPLEELHAATHSEDDLNLEGMTDEELADAWNLWFDLAQATNDDDPPYTHGVFVNLTWDDLRKR